MIWRRKIMRRKSKSRVSRRKGKRRKSKSRGSVSAHLPFLPVISDTRLDWVPLNELVQRVRR